VSDFANLAVGLVMAGSAAIGATRKILERRRARRELRSRPVMEAATDEGNVVRVTGVVRAGDTTLTAPISGQTCVMYRSRVTDSMWSVRRIQLPKESFAMVPFALERDDGTRVTIEGRHALLDLPNMKLPAPKTVDLRERRTLFQKMHGIDNAHSATFEEVVVEEGMKITVAGLMMKDLAEEAPSGEAGYRDNVPAALRLAGDLEHPLVIGTG